MVGRVIWVTWVLNLVLFALLIPPTLLLPGSGWPLRIAAAAGLAGAVLWEAVAVRQGRFPIWADVLETAAVCLLSWRFPPYPPRLLLVVGFAFAALGFRCLFGGPASAAVRAVTMVAALYAGRVLTAWPDNPLATLKLLFPALPFPAFIAAISQVIVRTLRQQEALTHRQRVAARLNRDLIAARRPSEVHEAILNAVLDLFERQPGVRAIIWDESQGMAPVAARGDRAGEALAPGRRPHSLPEWIREAVVAGEPVYRDSLDLAAMREAIGFEPLPGVTLIVPLQRRQELRTLTVGSERPIPPTIRREIVSFAKVVEMALESITLNEQLRVSQEALRQRSYYDPLTRLANRDLLRLRLDWALARPGRDVALLLIDLDQFKTINDSLGHVAGDEALVEVAGRLAGCVRPGDTVARLGGDEFAIFLDRLEEPGDAERVARRVLDALDAPLARAFHHGDDVFLRGSIGVALSGPAARTPSDLLRNADVAMYAAKTAGGAVYRMFEPAMRASILDRLELESDLNRAVQRGELVLHYQPIVALVSEEIIGVEALVRWNHPQRGMIPPTRFIPVAEESGAIEGIGSWVLAEGCRQLREWLAAMPELRQRRFSLGVNLSPRQLAQPDLARMVGRIIGEARVEPGDVTLELTEGALAENTEANLGKLEALKALGLRLAIDDFGTGFSSLGYLRRFPFDVIKIDRAFVHGVDKDEDAAALARAIIRMSEALGLYALAEGVERSGEAQWLRAAGCPAAQGNLFAPALHPEALTPLLSKGLLRFSGQG